MNPAQEVKGDSKLRNKLRFIDRSLILHPYLRSPMIINIRLYASQSSINLLRILDVAPMTTLFLQTLSANNPPSHTTFIENSPPPSKGSFVILLINDCTQTLDCARVCEMRASDESVRKSKRRVMTGHCQARLEKD